MTKRWITNPRDRRTKKYRDLHDRLRRQLRHEVQQEPYVPRPIRHKIEHATYKQTGA